MKKLTSLLSVLFAVTLLFSSLSLVQASVNQTKPTVYTLGDVDGNQRTDAKDVLLVLQHTVGKIQLTIAQQQAAEVNGDGKINAKDALEILKYSVQKITKFPIEEITVTPTDVTATDQ